MRTREQNEELVNAMVRAAYENGRPEWLTLLAKRAGCTYRPLSPTTAADWMVRNDIATTWHAVARTHE